LSTAASAASAAGSSGEAADHLPEAGGDAGTGGDVGAGDDTEDEPPAADRFSISMMVNLSALSRTHAVGAPKERPGGAAKGGGLERQGSTLSKEMMKSVVRRYTAAGTREAAGEAWMRSRLDVDDLVAGRVTGARPQFSLEAHLVEATSLPLRPGARLRPTASLTVGREVLETPPALYALGAAGSGENGGRGGGGQGGRVLWDEPFVFPEIFNLYGTDLAVTIRYAGNEPGGGGGGGGGEGVGGQAVAEDRLVVPLACLDVDAPLDDWYLLSGSDGMVRLRLVLRPYEGE
jgi:hypothetical protein